MTHALSVRGVIPVRFEHSERFFDNFEVTFARGSFSFSVVRDRGQFHVGGIERGALEPVGLWRSFSGVQSLQTPLLVFVDAQDVD